jgi:hypothetical protein
MSAVPSRARPSKPKSGTSARQAKAKTKPKSSGWGGKRAGAGRKLTPGRVASAPHRVRALDVGRYPILVTMRALPEIPSLRSARVRELFESVLADQRERPLAKVLRIVAHAIDEKEVRLIVEGTGAKAQAALRPGMSGLSIAFARRLNSLLGRNGKVWSARWNGHELESPNEVRKLIASFGGRKPKVVARR